MGVTMEFVFQGAEVPSHRIILADSGVKAVSVSYWGLKRRGLPTTKDYLLADRFPDDMRIYVDSGASTANKSKLTHRELEEYAADYQDWVILNADRIHLATEFDSRVLGNSWVQEQRRLFWEELDIEKFIPIWNHELGHAGLFALAEQYPHVGIPGEAIEAEVTLSGRTQALSIKYGTSFHGLGIAKPDNLRQVPLESASTLSWVSPMMRGETIVWDGTKLVRYPARMKDQARPRYKAIIERAGLDFTKILEDDPNENVKLAIWSYLQLENSMNRGKLSDNSDDMDDPGNAETQGIIPDNSALEVGNSRDIVAAKVRPRDPKDRVILPIFATATKLVTDYDPKGREILREATILTSHSASLRQCNTCFVAANCPAFEAGSSCKFDLPVEVKTKDQLRSLLNTIIEMQGARVAFARYAEELNGGYPDPNTGQEIDRLLKELEENREFIKMTVERQGGAGVLSSIFGREAQVLGDLPGGGMTEEQTTRIITDGLEK
jgi:hypothetical protein